MPCYYTGVSLFRTIINPSKYEKNAILHEKFSIFYWKVFGKSESCEDCYVLLLGMPIIENK